nr:EOG090X020Z [Eurycercus lamellatus]
MEQEPTAVMEASEDSSISDQTEIQDHQPTHDDMAQGTEASNIVLDDGNRLSTPLLDPEVEPDGENQDLDANDDEELNEKKSKTAGGFTGRGVTLQMLLEDNILQAKEEFKFGVLKGQKFNGDLLADGKIFSAEVQEVFSSPSAFKMVTGDRQMVKHESLGNRATLDDPNLLVETVSFAAVGKLQPFLISLNSAAQIVMEVHCSLTRSEVVGYLGGTWDMNSNTLTVKQAYPCLSRLGDERRGQAVEVKIAQSMEASGLSLIGWYHSHPSAPPTPTIQDIDAQLEHQLKMKGTGEQGYRPCIAMISSPFYQTEANQTNSSSTLTCYWVSPPPESRPQELGRPMAMQYNLVYGTNVKEEVVPKIDACLSFYKEAPDRIKFEDYWTGEETRYCNLFKRNIITKFEHTADESRLNIRQEKTPSLSGETEFASEAGAPGGLFHADYKRHDDLKQMLDSSKDSLKLEAMKRIIGMVAKGRDASDLFPAVVKNVVSKNIEVKKLVYVYLVRYAEEQQDLALLSISTFQRALKDPNQLIRASALRVLSSIRVPVIVPIMMLAIRDSVSDMSPYVRKTAAHAIPKLFDLDPEQKDELVMVIEKLLSDQTTLVVGSAVMAFEQVVMAVAQLYHHLAPRSDVAVVARALIRLLRSHREVQTVVLNSVASMSVNRKDMFEPFLKNFFVRSTDATQIKLLKLEILTNLASESNITFILREFQTYICSQDKDLVAAAIQAIGRCAAGIKEVTDVCLSGLIALLSNADELIVAESVVVIKKLLQTQQGSHGEIQFFGLWESIVTKKEFLN